MEEGHLHATGLREGGLPDPPSGAGRHPSGGRRPPDLIGPASQRRLVRSGVTASLTFSPTPRSSWRATGTRAPPPPRARPPPPRPRGTPPLSSPISSLRASPPT